MMAARTTGHSTDRAATPVGRKEAWTVVILIACGFLLRAWQLTSLELDHFDEGVYLFSALGLSDSSQPLRVYPDQILFAPPMFFATVGLLAKVGLRPDSAALALNALLGTATIPVVWWTGRRWFGVSAGVAAAALVAFSEYHIMLSRTALTDVAFALAFLVALGALVAAVTRGGAGRAVVAGLAVGLAWNTKYHGWFAVLAAGAAVVPYAWLRYRRDEPIAPSFRQLAIAAVVAGLCYLPWALFIESQPGGYAGLAAYQRTLVNADWWHNLGRQVQHQMFLDGPFSRASILAAAAVALLVAGRPLAGWRGPVVVMALLAGAASLLGGNGALVLLAALAVPILLMRSGDYAAWVLLAWLGLWVTSAPLYSPYARLLLPLTIATCLACGVVIASIVDRLTRERGSVSVTPVAIGLAAALAVGLATSDRGDGGNPWRRSQGVSAAVDGISAIVPAGQRVVVIGEPTIAFYLHVAGRPAFERVDDPNDLEHLDTPVFLVTGVYARRLRSTQERLKAFGGRLTELASFPINPRDLRLQDDSSPANARAFRRSPDDTFRLVLYRLSPSEVTP